MRLYRIKPFKELEIIIALMMIVELKQELINCCEADIIIIYCRRILYFTRLLKECMERYTMRYFNIDIARLKFNENEFCITLQNYKHTADFYRLYLAQSGERNALRKN